MKNKLLFVITLLLPILFLISPNIIQANPLGILPNTEIANGSDTLYGKYPCVGANEWSVYYLDTTSAYAHTDGNVATLSCIVLNTSSGANPDGSPAKVYSSTYIFKTFKQKKKRIITLENLTTASGIVVCTNIDATKDKYFYALFGELLVSLV